MNIFKTLREKHPNELVLFIICLILFVVMAIMSPDVFLTGANMRNLMAQMPEFGLMAFAMMAAVLTGGMNLSIITGASLAAIIASSAIKGEWMQAHPGVGTLVGVLIVIGFSILTGILNGWLIGYIGIVAMLVTLGTRMIFEGLGLVITKGNSIGIRQEPYLNIAQVRVGPIPLPMIIYIVMIIFTYYMLERSKWGHQVYMIGDNEVATRFSGVNTKRTIMLVYVFSGLMYGISSVLITSRVCSAKTDYGTSYLMNAVTAVVMGGTDITGGSGTVAGTVLAVLILQILSNGFTVFRLDQNLVNIFTGCILILVLGIRYLTGVIIDRKKIKARQAAAAAK